MSDDRFDAIIAGAGPAGIACAYVLAREGKSVLVVERGHSPGSKNVTGGRVYTYALELVEKGIYAEAALERKVTREQLMLLSGDRAVTVDCSASFVSGDISNSYTVLRAVFDEWFAQKAEEQGAIIACGIRIDGVIEQDGKIAGVRAGDDELYADVVIAADGVNSLIAQSAGIREEIPAESVGVGIKEVIELPAPVIEERFNLNRKEGAARLIVGCTEGIHGGGFLYTNRESISLGCVFMPHELAKHGRQIHELFQDFKLHPSIYPLIAGGTAREYSAHLVPEKGWRGVPRRLYRDGLLLVGDAAGFVMNTGMSIRGIDLAIVSGVAAARAVLQAGEAAKVGKAYIGELETLGLIQTMKAAEGYVEVMDNPRIYSVYPKLATEMAQQMFTVDGSVPPKMSRRIKRMVKENASIWQIIRDVWGVYRSL